jgi:hypothetical protein
VTPAPNWLRPPLIRESALPMRGCRWEDVAAMRVFAACSRCLAMSIEGSAEALGQKLSPLRPAEVFGALGGRRFRAPSVMRSTLAVQYLTLASLETTWPMT